MQMNAWQNAKAKASTPPPPLYQIDQPWPSKNANMRDDES